MVVGSFPAVTVGQMREVDRLAIEEYGLTLLQMMENAGRALAAVARHLLGGSAAGKKIVVLAGGGGNGGGGLAAARHLANAGARGHVALAAQPDSMGDAVGRQRSILLRSGIAGSDRTSSPDELTAALTDADLLLDALIGYGLAGRPREPADRFIAAANAAAVPILALDLPSGLDGDRGPRFDPAIQARATVTLAWPKEGLLVDAARPFVGDLYLADIGIPTGVYQAVGVSPGTMFSRGSILPIEPAAGGWRVGTMREEVVG